MSRPHADENVFRAIADPTRRRIIDQLRKGDRPVIELIRSLNVSPPTLSHHLAILRSSGLVAQRRRGRQRIYRFDGSALRPALTWLHNQAAGASRG